MRGIQPLISLGLLFSLVPRRPREFRDRVAGYTDLGLEWLSNVSPAYETVRWEKALGDVDEHFGRVAGILEEPALEETEENTRKLLKDIRGGDAFSLRWAADSRLARLCYVLCRLIGPSVVVETGVAYGVSSTFILRALEENGHGTLYSVDLPPLRREYERFWGVAVPDTLRGRWELHRGSSARVLPRLLEEKGMVDLFLHDSLHTHRNMRREFDTVWPQLRTGGALLADDVERNRAFGELQRKSPALWRVVRDREESPLHGRAAPIVFGIAVK
ncbi:MAG TPA: class I SAM-dependent methyltransferase [Rubrobacter sp.]|nr:class I SAM-dependent methyltransferase [Rubrobacter sp.]